MITVEELRKRKEELGYTNAMIAEIADLPLSTVQKIFGGFTSRPRYDTLLALDRALAEYSRYPNGREVREEASAYSPLSGSYYRPAENSAGDDMIRWPRQGTYTLKDYFAIPDDIRVELIDGVIYDMSAPSKIHQQIQIRLASELLSCTLEHEGECEVFVAPTDVRLDRDDRSMVQPDIFVICHDDDNRKYVDGAPEFIAEILSDSTRSRDCLLKLNKYLNAGVKEYWIIDPKTLRVIVYLFEEDILPHEYSFDDTIPVGISDGQCEIDFARIRKGIEKYL